MLSLTENLHTILRVLYDDMMALCYPMSQVAMAIAGIGALLYIAYRVWQSLAQAEPIDLFPLMRPSPSESAFCSFRRSYWAP